MPYGKDPYGNLTYFPTQQQADAFTASGQYTPTSDSQANGVTQAPYNMVNQERRFVSDLSAGRPGQTDPLAYQYNNDPYWAANENEKLQAQGAGYAGRAAPTIDTSKMDPYAAGASGAAGQLGGISTNLSGVATGTGYQGQLYSAANQSAAAGGQTQAGDTLMKLAVMPAGPSAAEMAMKRTMDQGANQQASMAAGARGGNAALAMQNAAANEAQIQGQGVRDIGTQRAAEDITNRTFAANAASAAGQAYGGAGSTYGGAGSTYGGAAGTQTSAYGTAAGALQGQGGINTTLAGQYGQVATDNSGNVLKNNAVNDASQMGAQNMGYGLMGNQLQANENFDTGVASRSTGAAESTYANRDKSGEGTLTGSAGGDKAAGAGMTALSAMAAMSDIRAKKNIVPAEDAVSNAFRGMGQQISPEGSAMVPVMPTKQEAPQKQPAQAQRVAPLQKAPTPFTTYSYGGNELRPVAMSPNGMSLTDTSEFSDINAKKNITYAPGAISDAFRTARSDEATLRGSSADFPDVGGYGYDYKDPNMPGARPGRNYGPMAQELEQTPAGASVVKDTPKGKAIDTSRLSLLNASETSRLRKEVDALKQGQPMADEIRGTQVVRPDGYDDPYGSAPPAGYMPGRMHLDPGLAPQVPHGSPRPFAPGEYVRNPDGSWSSEVSMSVENPRVNGGRPTNIPSMWLKDGKPYLAKDENEAAGYAAQSGLPFRSYGNIDAANQASIDRESQWQPIQNPKDARRVEPLWDPNGKAARVQATPLVFSSENGGNFRTPDEQLAYVDSVKRRPAPTPLFFGDDNGGTFRTPLEQLRYANALKSPPTESRGEERLARTDMKIDRLATSDADEEARIRKLKAQIGSYVQGADDSLSVPTTSYPQMAYGY